MLTVLCVGIFVDLIALDKQVKISFRNRRNKKRIELPLVKKYKGNLPLQVLDSKTAISKQYR